MKNLFILFIVLLNAISLAYCQPGKSIFPTKTRIAIVGLSHGHTRAVFKQLVSDKVEIVGIAESNPILIEHFRKQYNLPAEILFTDLDEMLKKVKPEGVAVFTSTFDHLDIVKSCAPLGIHVMVEKPLAVSEEQVILMRELAEEYNIFVITNYETTWHPALNLLQKRVFEEVKFGQPRKVVFHHGTSGPKQGPENNEFFKWLTDPVLNGGGAIMDFGCYGINLLTYWLNGKMPVSVFAQTQQFHPELYPKVDDETTIILNYDSLQCIIMASWNWAIPRKDAEVYAESGYFIVDNSSNYRFRGKDNDKEEKFSTAEFHHAVNQSFPHFAALIRGDLELKPFEPGSIENNQIVMEILDLARKSAKEQRVIYK